MSVESEYFFSFKQNKLLQCFPETSETVTYPDGLLVAGGSLNESTLIEAYTKGIFPWGEDSGLPLWWAPDPRAVLFPEELKISKSLSKIIKKNVFRVTFDREFDTVISACGPDRNEATWISPGILNAYTKLFNQGRAHSVECWFEGEVCGGLYGVTIGQVFFGESMYSKKRDASKVALVFLCDRLRQWGYQIIDCQVNSEHLVKLGAKTLPKYIFEDLLNEYIKSSPSDAAWRVL